MSAKVITNEQFHLVVEVIMRFSTQPLRDRLFIELTFLCGLRANEVAHLELRDVTDATGQLDNVLQVNRRGAKNGRARPFPMPDILRAHLRDHLDHDGWQAGPIFWSQRGKPATSDSVQASLKRWYVLAGLPNCSSHSGRRSFTTAAARTAQSFGASLKDVQKLVGHASLATTELYIDSSPQADALARGLWGPAPQMSWAEAQPAPKIVQHLSQRRPGTIRPSPPRIRAFRKFGRKGLGGDGLC
ncbi:MAG: CcrRogue [Hyphomicrobiales bacterium]|nr:CcrRogue [Hyphomicrobiales bacterium]